MVKRYNAHGNTLVEVHDGAVVAHTDYARLKARYAELEKERGEARAANERDRSEVIIAVNALTDAFSRRDWLLRGGRGSYEWDDERFRDEFRDAMAEFEPHVEALRKIGADRSNCPETRVEVLNARATLRDRIEREPVVKAAQHVHEVFETLNEWFAQRQSGEKITNSETAMFNKVHQVACMLEAAIASAPEAEPVAWMRKSWDGSQWTRLARVAEIWREQGISVTALYDSPPAPVVTEAQIATAYRASDVADENPYGLFKAGFEAALASREAT